MRSRVILLLLLSANLGLPDATAVTIPTEVKNIVTFVFLRNPKGNLVPQGTGFFVAIKGEQNPDRVYGYLVTAKHVIRDKHNRYFASIFIRLNKRTRGAEFLELPLQGKDALPVYVHRDPDVDLAVLPILPNRDIFEFKVLPQEMLTTTQAFKQANIKEGDEVFFTGLFWQFFVDPGSYPKRNYPIVRFGRVALVTDERIPWKEGNKTISLDLYLIEALSFGGNSGSPVFFYLGGEREPGTLTFARRLLLAGVIKGTFLDHREIQAIEVRKALVASQSVGISAVVPSYKLHDILFSPELRSIRAKTK